ncbi:5662_t:CDS:1 [Acaulospora morrowiae]|uniref:5662_t:CDS:1 n=1 Tax=Acaulospora morrowiae TaxID=94023 RepID=A0A9N8ZH74_9GLOM|nr:5662_t:CDS:1 [Acaulospora morrowiae]
MSSSEKQTVDSPPSYSENESTPTIPSPVYVNPTQPTSISQTSLTPSDNVLLPDDSSLPSYDHVKVDIPPEYPSKSCKQLQLEHPWNLVPLEPQEAWPITKKLYVAGFLIWPLWYLGVVYSLLGKDAKTKMWGKRCFLNSLLITAVYVYIVIAICRSRTHST